MAKSSRKNILISGYYGFNNIGDESILRAVVDNLKHRIPDASITVLSQDPSSTRDKYRVESADRRSVISILRALARCDILISGGGSLLQDVTSKRSILYYLFIIRAARMLRKKVLIYSQGIGPINTPFNRRATARVLRKADGIVVRDEASRELLQEIGLTDKEIVVTADPVLRIPPAPLEAGRKILAREGFVREPGKITVGFAIRERKTDSRFVDQLAAAMERLRREEGVQLVLIPFHYSEDMAVIDELQRRLGGQACALRHKYLTDEMLSIIGNMDMLVGVRLHALIHAAIMEVPMIGISYDPKVNSFLHSIGLRAMCSIYDFDSDFFVEEFGRVWADREKNREKVRAHMETLRKRLDTNEEIIKALLEGPHDGTETN